MSNLAKSAINGAKKANAAKFTPSFPEGTLAYNSSLTLSDAYNTLVSIGADTPKSCIKHEELAEYLKASAEKKFQLKAYDGFEPSGRMHIAQGLLKTVNVNKMTKCGVRFVFLVADWFAHLNNKMGGDLAKIRIVGEYFIEVWRACGMDLGNVDFLWSSEEINKRPDDYWRMASKELHEFRVRELLTSIHQNRDTDSALPLEEFLQKYPIQEPADEQPVAQLLYPLMQCTDIFFLGANICQLGADQLKVNMLAREFCDVNLGRKAKKLRKPVVLSHPMLMGLKEGQAKMSKSDPDSAVFMEDSAEDVRRKLKKAFCRPQEVENNPVLDYLRNVIFPWRQMKLDQKNTANNSSDNKITISAPSYLFKVARKEKDGGEISFSAVEAAEAAFLLGELHPADLKAAVAAELNDILEPVRQHFASGKPKELLKKVKSFRK